MNLENLKVGVSPLTNTIFLYKLDKRYKNENENIVASKKKDITHMVVNSFYRWLVAKHEQNGSVYINFPGEKYCIKLEKVGKNNE